jgi:hypothetical protein
MDQMELIKSAIQQAVSRNKLYTTYEPIWRYLLESYVGGEEYRQAEHLIRYQLETPSEYGSRLAATPLDNHCQGVISVYNSFLFREPPKRELGRLDAFMETEEFLRDCDFDGRSLDAFMKDLSTWASVFGTCWALVVKPNVEATTRADEQAQGVRPYVSLLTPLVVLDWQWQRSPTGRYELTEFKYIEDIQGDVQTVKQWTKEMIYTKVIDLNQEQIIESYEDINGLGKIPAVCIYNRRGIVRGIGVSDITDIADHQRFIYNCYSEIMQSIQMDTHPSLVATPETRIGTGSGALIHMPENLDPQLKPYLLEFSGAGVEKILSSIKASVEAIEKMANIGSIRGTEGRRMSGVAQQQEFELLNARLSEKADNLELGEEQIWRLFCDYMQIEYDGEIDYPNAFNIRDTESEIQQLKIARDTATDARVLAMIDHEIIEWLGEDSDLILGNEPYLPSEQLPQREFFEPHTMVNPETGERFIARTEQEHMEYQAQGYYHE